MMGPVDHGAELVREQSSLQFLERLAAGIIQWERRLAGDGGRTSSSGHWVAAGLWVAAVVALVMVVHLTGFPVLWEKVNDLLVILDTGWRVWNGQVPHRDFYCIIGPFPVAVFTAGIGLRHPDISGFPMALAIVGVGFSALSWLASEDRLTIWWRLAIAWLVLVLPVAPVFLGGGEVIGGSKGPPFDFVGHTSYAMQYNRLGWAAMVLQMLITLIPRRHGETRRQILQDSVLGGVMLGLGVYCKINYLLASVALAAWWICCRQNPGKRLAGLLAGFSLVTAVLTIFPGGAFAYFLDQWRLIHVSRHESHVQSLLARMAAIWPWLVILVLLHFSIMAGAQLRRTDPAGRAEIRHLSLNFLVALALSLLIVTFNTQYGEIPGLLVAGLITLELALRANAASGADVPREANAGLLTKTLVLKICCLALVASALFYDGGSLLYAMTWKLRKARWADESEPLPGLLKPMPIPVYFNEPTKKEAVERALVQRRSGPWLNTGADNYMTPLQTARWINDGVELLTPRVKPSDRIFAAAWYNPFNLALDLPPARGGTGMHWDHNRYVDAHFHPDVRRALAEVTLFMVPKRADWKEQVEYMLNTYGQGLGTDFHVVGESQFWTCWAR
jgi:hypothetical protein